MQRRWEEQLAGYVAASFRVLSLGNTREPDSATRQQRSSTASLLYFGAKLVIDGSLSVGELVAFNILAGRVSAPVLRLAQMWQDFHQAALCRCCGWAISSTPQRSRPIRRDARGCLRSVATSRSTMSASAIASTDRKILHDVSFDVPARTAGRHRRPFGVGQRARSPKLVQRLYVPESGRVLVDGMDLAMADPAWLRRQIGVVLQENVLFNRSVRENIALRRPGHADGARPSRRHASQARTNSSSN